MRLPKMTLQVGNKSSNSLTYDVARLYINTSALTIKIGMSENWYQCERICVKNYQVL
jgi:hypothetical protein